MPNPSRLDPNKTVEQTTIRFSGLRGASLKSSLGNADIQDAEAFLFVAAILGNTVDVDYYLVDHENASPSGFNPSTLIENCWESTLMSHTIISSGGIICLATLLLSSKSLNHGIAAAASLGSIALFMSLYLY
ncbi:hypothetical protein FRC04_006669 [Tulasnella sp. 424]|nr:hypothetical protein FRC04_006669 [Tulasnella sp. 424]